MALHVDRLYPPPGPGSPPGFPTITDLVAAIAEEHRPIPANRPWVLTNMITSLDGATTVEGLSGGLGRPADSQVFAALRAVADVVIVGATTARVEGYRRPRPNPTAIAARRSRGQTDAPRLAIVSGSLSVPSDLPAFDPGASNEPRPLLFTGSETTAERRRELSEVADVEAATTPIVDPHWVLERLFERGARVAILEGGPTLNGLFASAGCIDEWNLTVAPDLVSGTSARATHGQAVSAPTAFVLTRLWFADGLVFGRWVATGSSEPAL
ncbi:MAG: dihydrofolate reductase family protein [Actinomycetota bacterium]|nr:dihydrofolate reductase family protein [Actinomycetota bacterium]